MSIIPGQLTPISEITSEDRGDAMIEMLFNMLEEAYRREGELLAASAFSHKDVFDDYNELSQLDAHIAMLDKIRESLKPDGRLVLLEYRKEDPNIPIRPEHKMSVAEVRAEIEPEGFRFDKNLNTLPRQHILVFRKSVQ